MLWADLHITVQLWADRLPEANQQVDAKVLPAVQRAAGRLHSSCERAPRRAPSARSPRDPGRSPTPGSMHARVRLCAAVCVAQPASGLTPSPSAMLYACPRSSSHSPSGTALASRHVKTRSGSTVHAATTFCLMTSTMHLIARLTGAPSSCATIYSNLLRSLALWCSCCAGHRGGACRRPAGGYCSRHQQCWVVSMNCWGGACEN